MTEDEQQICAVVDHKKLEHQWLWKVFGSKVRENVGADDVFDEAEDLPDPPPRQELAHPENVIVLPDESADTEEEFEVRVKAAPPVPLKNWGQALEAIAYPSQTVTITGQDITSVDSTELTEEGWVFREEAAPYAEESQVEVEPPDFADGLQEELLAMADRLLERAGHSSQFKGRIYKVLLDHVRTKFLDGASLRLAEQAHLAAAWRMRSEVEKADRGPSRVGRGHGEVWRSVGAASSRIRAKARGASRTTTAT